jgi:hypothetical protein
MTTHIRARQISIVEIEMEVLGTEMEVGIRLSQLSDPRLNASAAMRLAAIHEKTPDIYLQGVHDHYDMIRSLERAI